VNIILKPQTLKVQTLNLWHHPIEYQARMAALIKKINNDTPDVLFLQEVTFPATGLNSAEILARETNLNIVSIHMQANPARNDGVNTGNAIMSILPPVTSEPKLGETAGYRQDTLIEPSGYIPLIPNFQRTVNSSAVYAWLRSRQGNDILAISAHLSWGVFNEYQRLQESIDINNLARSLTKLNPGALTVFGGSMNATPESDSVRFMTGKMAIEASENFWVDCWDHCNLDEEGGETQTPRNVWSKFMAGNNGTFDTGKLPKRRIDYIFVRDWVFGQTGSPISSKVAFAEPLGSGNYADATVSDHYGVEAILYDLPRQLY
jgi:endonuclease/exonuclease/phosphatase family metal-dependent hydrolase